MDTIHDLMTRYRNENCSNLAYVFLLVILYV